MCFSASSSFLISAVGICSGSYCVSRVNQINVYDYLPIALTPILFGIQQGLEGMVWLSLNSADSQITKTYALGFLFFSHFLWPFWMTFSVLKVETGQTIKKVLIGLLTIGFLYGVFLYFPLLVNPDWLSVNQVYGSIQYRIHVMSHGIVSPYLGILLYMIVALLGLMLSSHRGLNYLGGLIFIALIFSQLLFNYALISVWCFFAAVTSSYLLYFFSSEELFQTS